MTLSEFIEAGMKDEQANAWRGRNQMLADLGMDKKHFDDEMAVQGKIRELNATFDLVMIVEHFQESLVLFSK